MSVEDRIKALETTVEELSRRVASLEADSKLPKVPVSNGRRPSQGRPNVTSTPGRNTSTRKSFGGSSSVSATPGKTGFARSPNLPPSTPQQRKSSLTSGNIATPSRALPQAVAQRLTTKAPATHTATKASAKEFYFIAGHKVYVDKPHAFKDYKGDHSPPKADLRMNHVYGYNGKNTNGSLFFSSEDELVYPIAGTAVVYNATSHQQRFFVEHDEDITALTITHSRTIAATGQRDPKGKEGPYLCVWDIKTTKLIVKISYHEHGIAALCFSSDDKYLVSFGEGDSRFGAIWDWHAEAKKKDGVRVPLTKFSAPKEKILSISSSPPAVAEESKDGSWSFISVGEKSLKHWKVTPQKGGPAPTGKPKDAFVVTGTNASTYKQTKEIQKCYQSVAYLPGGVQVVGCYSGHVYVMQGEKFLKSIQVTKPNVPVGAVVAVPDGFVAAASDGIIRRYSSDWKKTGPVSTFESFPGKPQFQAGDFKDGKLVFGSKDSSIFTLDLEQFANLTQVMVGHRDEIKALAINPVNSQFASGGWDKTIRFWDFSTRVYGDEIVLKRQIYSLAWSRDGNTLAYGTKEGTVGLIQDGKLKGEDKKVGTQMINAMVFTPDDKEILCGCDDNVLYFIDATNLKLLRKGAAHSSAITHLSVSADGKVVATNSRDYQIMYWAVATGKRLLTDYPTDLAYDPWSCLLGWPVQGIWFEAENGSDVNAVAISGKSENQLFPGKGNLVVSGDDWGQVNLFNYPVIQKKPPVKKYRGHSAHVYSLSFTPNDKYLLTSGAGDLALIQWRVKRPGDPEEDPEDEPAVPAAAEATGDAPAGDSEEKGTASEEQPATEEQGAATEEHATEEQPAEEQATEEQPAEEQPAEEATEEAAGGDEGDGQAEEVQQEE